MSECLSCTLHRDELFCHLSHRARTHLDTITTRVRFPRGAVFFREGDHCESVYLICTGRAKLSVTSSNGKILILRIAEAGAALAMGAVLSHGSHELTAEAIEPTELRVIRREAFLDFLQHENEASIQVARSLADDYRTAFNGVCRLGLSSSPTSRLARLLLDWKDETGVAEQVQGRIRMPYTHEELASMTATSRETVTRTLSRFRKDNLISIKGISMTVLQPDALELLSAS